MSRLIALLAVLLISGVLIGGLAPVAHSLTVDQGSAVFVTPVRTCCVLPSPTNTASFTVNVMLNLTGGQSITGFDIRLNYTDYYSPPHGSVRAVGIDDSNNLFTDHNPSTAYSCIDFVAYGPNGNCPSDDEPGGQVHYAQTMLGTTLYGPISNALLFRVTFTVNATGRSLFYFDRANIVNTGPANGPPNPQYVPVVAMGAVFGNNPLDAFFNFTPGIQQGTGKVAPTVIVSSTSQGEGPATFDASMSFACASAKLENLTNAFSYNWDFGDGRTAQGVVVQHLYVTPANYTVTLTVQNATSSDSFSRPVFVSPALGNLQLFLKNIRGGPLTSGLVRVMLYNYTAPPVPLCGACNVTASAAGDVQFKGLRPGLYTLKFVGPTIYSNSTTAEVDAGWTRQQSVYLNEIPPPGSNPQTDFALLIFGGFVGSGIVIATVSLLLKRRNHPAKNLARVPASNKKRRSQAR